MAEQYSQNQLYPPPPSQDDKAEPVRQLLNLTKEEMQILKECRSESFYYRCVPLSFLLSGLVYIGVKGGHINGHPKHGSIPKMVMAIAAGYVGGKLSYQSKCMEKIMKLENSPLADSLRAKKQPGMFGQSRSTLPVSYGNEEPLSTYSDSNSPPLMEEYYPDLSHHPEGTDGYDSVKDALSSYTTPEDTTIPSPSYTSYDELRKINREKAFSKQSYGKKPPTSPPTDSNSGYASGQDWNTVAAEPTPKIEPYFNPNKNKYGDVWDK